MMGTSNWRRVGVVLAMTAALSAPAGFAAAQGLEPPPPPVSSVITFDPEGGTVAWYGLGNRIDNALRLKPTKLTVLISKNTTELPKPLAAWLVQIAETGGELRTKSLTGGIGDMLLAGLSFLLLLVGDSLPAPALAAAREMINAWRVTPATVAGEYNAVTVTAKQGGTTCYVAVQFYRRDSAEWTAAKAASLPVAAGDPALAGAASSDVQVCPFQTPAGL